MVFKNEKEILQPLKSDATLALFMFGEDGSCAQHLLQRFSYCFLQWLFMQRRHRQREEWVLQRVDTA